MRAFFLRIPLIIFALLLSSLACNVSAKDSPSPAPIQPNQETTSPVPDASIALSSAASVTKQVNAVLGGKIELITPAGDQVLLIIPPFALLADTEITLSALASAPQNPIAATFFPGISIQPDQITLRLPATLMVIPSAAPPGLAPMLFFLKHPDLVLPLGQQAREGDALSGKLLHFSTYTGGSPTGDEALSQAEQAASQTGGSENWRGDFENTQAVGEWSGNLESLGLPEDAAQTAAQASEQLKAQIECLFDLNCTIVPLDPCGDYQQQLMQYFKQATLLGFDPEGSLMTQLYAELERVLNECTNRYTLEYNHQLSVNRDGLNQEIQVTGKVLMNAPIYGVFDLGDPLKPQGSGSVDVKITGTMVSDDQTCSIAGSGQHSVEITGELVADEMGEPWMALDVTENWYTSGSMTITCPDGDSQTVPIPNAGSQTYPLRFQYINGAKSMAPNLGGMQGSYNWILHILHSW